MIPQVAYPLAIDSDYTLFRVYNSSHTVLAKDILINDDLINIVPQNANDADVWNDNGFVTIEDELIYYDKAVKNDNGKVYQLKDCVRGLEGVQSSHRKNTAVMANVVAQLHNQLVDAVIAIEDAIGEIGDMLKIGQDLKQGVRKSLAKPKELLAPVDFAFKSSLHQSLSTMLSFAPVGDDACPDVEFDFNNLGTTAEFCVRIYGNYISFQIDFGDGIVETNQLSGVHQYAVPGPYNPTVTVVAASCTIVQSSSPPDDFGPSIPEPSIPFVVSIPDFPAFPQFVPQKQICPGPLLNLPPIIVPGASFSQVSTSCPSIVISIVEVSTTPQIISVISPCQISILSLTGCNIPSEIVVTGCCPPSEISIIGTCISFCEPPSFALISFADVPSFALISFDTPPTISVDWGTPPVVSCVIQVACPSTSSTTQGFMGPIAPFEFANFNEDDSNSIPLTINDIGIPEEIKLIVPNIPDLKLIHDIPKEISINFSNIPTKILVEAAPDFPSKVIMEVVGMRDTIEVIGIPKTIEVVGIPKEIQLVMPENPVVEMRYSGAPLELKASPDLEKMLSNLIIVPK